MSAPNRSVAPPISQFADVHLSFPTCQCLSNGIPLWVVGGGDKAINRLNIYVRSGLMRERRVMQSMLTAMMVMEGSTTRDSEQIAQQLDYYGSWKSAQSHDEYSEVTLSSINSRYDRTLPIVMECLEAPTFPVEPFEVLKRRYAANAATQRERVKYLAVEEMRRLYYGENHPLSRRMLPEDILSLTIADLQQFYQQYYHPSNCRVVLSGNVTDEVMRLTDEILGRWNKPGEETPDVDWTIHPSEQMNSVVDKPGAVQSAVLMALQAVPRNHPDYLVLRFLVMVLGGYFGSRLMSNIREDKGYTYGINAYLAGREHDAYIGISTECDVRYTHWVIDEVRREMDRLCREPIPAEELATVRQYMLSDLVKTLDTPFSVAGYVSSTLLYGVYPEYFNEQVATILRVTPEQLLEVACRYLRTDALRTVIAGDSRHL